MAAKEIIEYLFKGNPTDLLNATRKVEGGLKGVDDQADKTAAGVNQSFSKMASNFKNVGDKMQRTGAVLTAGVTVPLAIALKGMADAAVQDQAALGKLEGQLKRTTGATRDQLDQVNEYIDKTSVAVGVADDQLRPAFERLARASGSTEQAQKDLNLALDVSRATGKDLETVAQAMGRAYDGSTGALGRLGVATKDAAGNTLDLKTIMENMNRQFGGAANDWANTAAGRAEIARIRFDELKEQIGANLVPVMEDLADIASTVIKFFAEMPDWAQKASVGIGLLSGPLTAVGGTLLKFVGDWKNRQAIIAAVAGETADAVGRHGVQGGAMFADGMKRGTHEARSGLQIFGRTVASAGIFAGLVLSIERSIDGFSKWATAYKNAEGTVLERSQTAADAWSSTWMRAQDRIGRYLVPGMAQFADAQRDAFDPKNSKEFLELLKQAEERGGMYAQKAREVAGSSISAKDGVKQLNDVLKMSPAQIDPARRELEKLALASGFSADEIEALDEAFKSFTDQLDFLDKGINAQRAMEDLAQSIVELKQAQNDGETSAEDLRLKIRGVEDQATQTARAMVDNYFTALKNGTITEEEAATQKAHLIAALQNTKAEVPQVAGVIDGLTRSVQNVPVQKQILFQVVGVQDVLRGVDQMVDRFRNLSNEARNASRVTISAPQAAVLGARGAMRREAGGLMGFARGGYYGQNSGGGITDGVTYVIGEGRNPREYVIPTDPQYSRRAQTLLSMASAELGVPRQSVSSTFAPVINVSGGSDPQATAAAVADAVEQAFARKKRREGSLAFT